MSVRKMFFSRHFLIPVIASLLAAPIVTAQSVQSQPAPGLTLEEALQRVLDYNESIQVKLLENEIARRQLKAEKGIFEPAVVGSYDHIDSERPNTIEQRRSLGDIGILGRPIRVFEQENNLYNGGLEFLSPVGTRFRVGYTLQDLRNNLNRNIGDEYVTVLGATLTQPLLKGFGTAATMARIRLAAISSDIAFQDYRRQLMLIIARAESAYWDLYFSQEQERITEESLKMAETVLNDNRARVEAGRSSELEVLEAEAGVGLRRTRLSDARQRRAEAANQLATLFSGSGQQAAGSITAAQAPVAEDLELTYYDSYQDAFNLNPDYISRLKQVSAENIRLAFAKNQRLPQLDLKASYGLNGLGDSISSSWEDVQSTEFPAWTVGVELRIPVLGGIRERNELEAAKLNVKRSLLSLKEIEVQIANALDTALLRVRNLRDTVGSYESVIGFHQQLLETQMARIEVGRIDSRTVLETERDLFEARMSALEALIQYQKALLELQLIEGSLLKEYALDISKEDLQSKTAMLIDQGKFSGPAFDQLQEEVRRDYEKTASTPDTSSYQGLEQVRPMPAGRSSAPSSPATPAPSPVQSAPSVPQNPPAQPAPQTQDSTTTSGDLEHAREVLRQRLNPQQ